MHAIMQLTGVQHTTDLALPSVALAWSWEHRGWGYCREFAELGFTALLVGPLHIQFDWGI